MSRMKIMRKSSSSYFTCCWPNITTDHYFKEWFIFCKWYFGINFLLKINLSFITRRSLLQSRFEPFVFEGQNARMAWLDVLGFEDHVISVGCQVVLGVPPASVAHLDVWAVWVWRLKIWDTHQVSLSSHVVHSQSFVHASACMLALLVWVNWRRPTPPEWGLRWVEFVVSLVIEWYSFISSRRLLHIGAGSNAIIMEEVRASALLSEAIWVIPVLPLFFRNDLFMMAWAISSGLKLV